MIRFVYSLPCVIVTAVALSAAAAPVHYAISAEQISSAISDAGMPVSPAEVMLLTQVRANTDAPKLKVKSIQSLGGRAAIVRMECETSVQCLPFFVKMESRDGESVTISPSVVQTLPSVTRASSRAIVTRAGTKATLLLEGARIHIRIPVVCIENGVRGEKIRVKAIGNQQLYEASVVEATLLKGSL